MGNTSPLPNRPGTWELKLIQKRLFLLPIPTHHLKWE